MTFYITCRLRHLCLSLVLIAWEKERKLDVVIICDGQVKVRFPNCSGMSGCRERWPSVTIERAFELLNTINSWW